MEVSAVDLADGEQSVARERAAGKLGDQELVGLDGRQVIAVVRELPSYFAVELGGIRQRSRTRAVGWVKAIHGLETLDQLQVFADRRGAVRTRLELRALGNCALKGFDGFRPRTRRSSHGREGQHAGQNQNIGRAAPAAICAVTRSGGAQGARRGRVCGNRTRRWGRITH